MRLIDADELSKWILGQIKSPSCPKNESAFGLRIMKHVDRMPSVQPVDKDINVSCKDAISRQGAIDHFKSIADATSMGNKYNEGFVDGLNFAVGYLETMPSVQSGPQWISCSERLPEDKTAYYLATVANRGLFFTTTVNNNVDYVRWDYDRRKGKDSWHWRTERTVLAWMPLPEPWKEGGQDETN